MTLDELFEDRDNDSKPILSEAKKVWARKGNTIVRKFRCTSGRKKGRLVAAAIECGRPIDLLKRKEMKKTMLAKGRRLRRKAQRTRKYNPASKRVQKLNKNEK